MSKILKLKNYYLINTPENKETGFEGIDSLQVWLDKQVILKGRVSRFRTRFLRLLVDRAAEVEKEKTAMLSKHADKKKVKEEELVIYLDDKGKDTTDPKEGKQYKINPENTQKFLVEYNAYLGEEFVIDVTPANRDAVYGVRDLILEAETVELSKGQATRYDEWATSFEAITEDK